MAGAGERGVAAEGPALGRTAALGALAWLAFASLHVALSPLVVDETALSAQILCGRVHYPAGHPHEVFHRQAFSLPNQLSGAVLALGGSLEVVSLLRNALVVFLSGFAPWLAALVVTRSRLAALASAALALSGAFGRFQGVYPTFVFPTFYSHGHVGAHAALVAATLLAGGFARTGSFLLGALPAVHPLLGALLWAQSLPRLARRAERSLPWLAAGLALTAASFAVSRALAPAEAPLPLFAPGDPAEGALVRSAFLELTDPHRRLPLAGGVFLQGYVANTAAFAALATLALAAARGARARAAARGLVLFGATAWAVVWGSRALEAVLGALPDALTTAMPYRLSNLSLLLLAPLAAAGLAGAGAGARTARTGGARDVGDAHAASRARAGAGALLLAGAVLAAAAAAALASLYPKADLPAAAGFGTLGLALSAGLVPGRGGARRVRRACAGGALVLAAVAALQLASSGLQPSAVLPLAALGGGLVVGALLLAAAARRDARAERVDAGGEPSEPAEPSARAPRGSLARAALALASLVAALVALRGSDAEPSSLVDDFDRDLVAWLDRHAGADELLLAPLQPRTQLQVKTGRPVLIELGTLWLMPYLPSLSGVIGRMTRELYGVDYGDREAVRALAGDDGFLGQFDPVWREAWQRRTRDAWRALGERWGFRLVLAPTAWGLDLEPALAGREWTLHRLPQG